MWYAFVLGPLAVTVRYWEERGEQVEGGARVELRRAESVVGRVHRPGAEGVRVLPVGEGGIWRADLFTVLSRQGRGEAPSMGITNEPCFHHHPQFRDGDVGPRVFDPEIEADPAGWTERKLSDLRGLLVDSGVHDIADGVDEAEWAAALPLIRAAIDACLAPPATTGAARP